MEILRRILDLIPGILQRLCTRLQLGRALNQAESHEKTRLAQSARKFAL